MTLKFNDNISYVKGEIGAKNILIDLKPTNLTEKNKTIENKLGQQQNYDDSILSSSTLKIDSYEINNKFKNNYKFCYGTNKCINSYEYITPTATGNYYKTLMKINGDIDINDNYTITNLTDFMNTFASINYQINGVWKTEKINTQEIKSNDYYIEVPYEIKDATNINFIFKIRNYSYKYILK